MNLNRSAGVLLHPTALPNSYGIGDFGKQAYTFIDFLAELKQTFWQILPLTIPEKGNSPYSPLSSFAGNPLLISLDKLVEDKLLETSDLTNLSTFQTKIDYSQVKVEKEKLLRKAFSNFSADTLEYDKFSRNHWLQDYSLFITLYEKNDCRPWSDWSELEKDPSNQAKQELIAKHQTEVNYHKFVQFIFYKQWMELKDYAQKQHIKIVGDIPIYVSYNSADVWANKELFQLDTDAKPQFISGCPPDNFNHDGQIWENPLYNWDLNKETGYKWWKERIAYNLLLTDIVRLDHFIGFTRYWSIPAELFDAKVGEWKEGPGHDFFLSLQNSIPNFNIIAEDLGLLTKEVTDLKNEFNFPGMIVLHYALDDNEFDHLKLPENTFIYTGTHDNNTTLGWWNEYAHNHNIINNNISKSLDLIKHNSFHSIDTISYDLINIAYSSSCLTAIIPLQDLLNLDEEYRMNRPGIAEGNWDVRIPQDYQNLCRKNSILEMLQANGRFNPQNYL